MKVLILGGYGNFGKRIAGLLTRKGIAVIIAGRDGAKAAALAKDLPPDLPGWRGDDDHENLRESRPTQRERRGPLPDGAQLTGHDGAGEGPIR